MRLKARKDRNQADIVHGLRAAGFSVAVLNQAGLPDLLIGGMGHCPACNFAQETNWTVELKQGRRVRKKINPGASSELSAYSLTPAQLLWYRDWLGQADVACTLEEALRVVGPKVVICQGALETVRG